MTDCPKSLRVHLAEQLGPRGLTDDQRRLALHVVSFVDRTGYIGRRTEKDEFLPVSLLEIASTVDPPTTPECIEQVLSMVQHLDPPGVAARDLRECLLLQVEPDTVQRDLVRQIILDHLEDVAHNRLEVISQRTGADARAVREAVETLSQFDPKPGRRFTADPPDGGPSR